jgi:hypothetical protein
MTGKRTWFICDGVVWPNPATRERRRPAWRRPAWRRLLLMLW